MLDNFLNKFKQLDRYKKRGTIYISIAALFLAFELLFHSPPRPTVILLWLGVIVIAVSIITSLKDPER